MTDLRPAVTDGFIFTYQDKVYTAIHQRRYFTEIINEAISNLKFWDSIKNQPRHIGAFSWDSDGINLLRVNSIEEAFNYKVHLTHGCLLAEVYWDPYGQDKIKLGIRMYESLAILGTNTLKLVPIYEEHLATLDGHTTTPSLFYTYSQVVGFKETEFSKDRLALFNLMHERLPKRDIFNYKGE